MRNVKIIALLAAGLALAGCDKEPQKDGLGELGVEIAVDATCEVNSVTRAQETFIKGIYSAKTAEFDLKIFKEDGSEFRTFTSVPTTPVKLPVGKYTASASYPGDHVVDEGKDEGFLKRPALTGTNKGLFTINLGKTTKVRVEPAVAGMVVTAGYTDAFKKYYSTWSTTILRGTTEVVKFDKGEARNAFIKAEAYKIRVDYTRPSNGSEEISGHVIYDVTTNIGPRKLHRITTGISGAGGSKITITFDGMDSVELEPIELGESEDE